MPLNQGRIKEKRFINSKNVDKSFLNSKENYIPIY